MTTGAAEDRGRRIGHPAIPGPLRRRRVPLGRRPRKALRRRDGNTDGLIAALRIVDDQVEAERRLERLARFDTLTGLANRAEAIAPPRVRVERPSASGHIPRHAVLRRRPLQGDQRQVGTRRGRLCAGNPGGGSAEASVKRTRLAGREATRYSSFCPASRAWTRSRRSRRRFAVVPPRRSTISGITIRATLSIGATMALPGEPVSAIMARADAAMYQAKLGDRNAVIQI